MSIKYIYEHPENGFLTKENKNEIDDAFSYAEDSDFPDYEDFKTAFHLNVI